METDRPIHRLLSAENRERPDCMDVCEATAGRLLGAGFARDELGLDGDEGDHTKILDALKKSKVVCLEKSRKDAIAVLKTMVELYPATNPHILAKTAVYLHTHTELHKYAKVVLAWWLNLLGEDDIWWGLSMKGEYSTLKQEVEKLG